MKQWTYVLCILSLLLIVGACNEDTNSSGGEPDTMNVEETPSEPEELTEEQEPVTVTIAIYNEEWLEEMKPKVEEKFPHITVEFMDIPRAGRPEFEDVILTGQIPDIIPTQEQRRYFGLFRNFDLEYDFEHIIEEKGFDLSIYDPEIIESYRNATPTGGIVALPHNSNYFALHYNKDIFDQFGYDYPTEAMTWSEVLDLAAELTRESEGTQYHGLSFNSYLAPFMITQFEENFIDPETNEVNIINSEAMNGIFGMVQQYSSISGNIPEGEWSGNFEEGNVAMDIDWARIWAIEEEIEGVNFDFAPFPTWEENPEVGVEPNVRGWIISKTAENKEAAFDVLSYITSPEALVQEIRSGHIPTFSDPEITDQFLADVDNAAQYNLDALFALRQSPGPPEISLHENNAPIRELMEQYVLENRTDDVASYLREVEQIIENYVIEQEQMQ